MKKSAPIILALIICLSAVSLSGCGAAADLISGVADSAAQIISGNINGEVGKAYSTQWFDFTVIHIKEVSEYSGYKPEAGYKLYDVLISETGTFDEAIPVGTFDFYMDDPSFDKLIFPIDPLSDDMMPANFELSKGENVEYHMVYEIPEDVTDLVLQYTEIDEDEATGAIFTIKIAK